MGSLLALVIGIVCTRVLTANYPETYQQWHLVTGVILVVTPTDWDRVHKGANC